MNKRYYYHVTQKNWAREVTLSPKEIGNNRPEREPKVARICVSPTPAHCFVALGQGAFFFGLYCSVYRTKYKVNAEFPHGVADSHITKEMWLKTPTEFKRVKVFSRKEFNLLYQLLPNCVGTKNRYCVAAQKERLKTLLRINWYLSHS
jgi:hypothetical protein